MADNPHLLAFLRDVAELPDRTSPEDAPDMMLVTANELRGLIAKHFPSPDPRRAEVADAIDPRKNAFNYIVGDPAEVADGGYIIPGALLVRASTLLRQPVAAPSLSPREADQREAKTGRYRARHIGSGVVVDGNSRWFADCKSPQAAIELAEILNGFEEREKAALASQRPAEGWVLVPREIEIVMMDAGQRYIESVAYMHRHILPAQFRWVDFWEAMLSAAPTPPSPAPTSGPFSDGAWRKPADPAPALAAGLTEEERKVMAEAKRKLAIPGSLWLQDVRPLLAIISRLTAPATGEERG